MIENDFNIIDFYFSGMIMNDCMGFIMPLIFTFCNSCAKIPYYEDNIIFEDLGVLKYGAYNDGTNPDETTLAINNCIKNEDNIYFPEGIYCINSSIILRCNTVIHGTENSVIYGNFDGVFMHADPFDKGDLLIKNLKIVGTGKYDLINYDTSPKQNGIYMQFVSGLAENITLENIKVYNINGGAIQIKGAKNVIVDNCHVHNTNFPAFTFVNEKTILKNSQSYLSRMFLESLGFNDQSTLTIQNCYAYGCYNYGIKFSGPGVIILNSVEIEGNRSVDLNHDQTAMFSFWFRVNEGSKGSINKCIIQDCVSNYMHIGIKIDDGDLYDVIETVHILDFINKETFTTIINNVDINDFVML